MVSLGQTAGLYYIIDTVSNQISLFQSDGQTLSDRVECREICSREWSALNLDRSFNMLVSGSATRLLARA